MTIWTKEWRELAYDRPTCLRRLLLPGALAGPVLIAFPHLAVPILAALLTAVGWGVTGAQVARERASGLLHRLALTPVRPGQIMLQKLLARTVIVWLQALPAALLAAWTGALPRSGGWLIGAPVALLLATAVATTAGCLTGLLVRSRRQAVLVGAAATAGAVLIAWAGARTGWSASLLWAVASSLAALCLALLTSRLSAAIFFGNE